VGDPLPSWNEGRSKNDIVNFVQRERCCAQFERPHGRVQRVEPDRSSSHHDGLQEESQVAIQVQPPALQLIRTGWLRPTGSPLQGEAHLHDSA
jgi:hypothetical protein